MVLSAPRQLQNHLPASLIDFLFKIPRATAGIQVLLLATATDQWHGATGGFLWDMTDAEIVC